MSTLTIRLKPREEELVEKIKEYTGKPSGSQALLSAARDNLKEIPRLKKELNKTKLENEKIRALLSSLGVTILEIKTNEKKLDGLLARLKKEIFP